MNADSRLLVATVQRLSMANNLKSTMQIVRTAARQLANADGATFVVKENNHCYYADEDAIEPLWKGQRFPLQNCVSGHVMTTAKSAVIPDVFADPRIPHNIYKETFVKSMAMVPIRTDDPIGAIGIYWSRHHEPTEAQMELLQALADVTAVTMENIRVHNNLEKAVQERTHELQNLNRDLELFAYSVSHDLRAPLRGINGFLTILREDHPEIMTPDVSIVIDRVLENASQMTDLIDDLLNFFKLGQKDPVKTKLPMKLMATEIAQNLKSQEKRRQIAFQINDLPDCFGDNVLIKQVWTNLIDNAIKYTSKKSKSLIEIGYEDQEDTYVYFVSDNGSGFEMAYYDQLFGIFQRLHSQKEFTGNGIGLAIVERIITRHGGKVWANSALDEGATFYFSLPK
jgi:K+-sensing histidine kinase KdpD